MKESSARPAAQAPRAPSPRLDALLDGAERLSSQGLFIALQRGFILALPLVMVGALATMLLNLPVPAVRQGLDALAGPAWREVCSDLAAATMGIASLAVLCSISGVRAMQHNQRHSGHFVNPITAIVVALTCFVVLVGPADTRTWKESLSMDQGLLLALAVAFGSSWALLRLSRWDALLLPLGHAGHDPAVRDVLALLPAAMLTIVLCGLLRAVLLAVGIASPHQALAAAFGLPFARTSDGLPFGLLYSGLSQLLWLLGLHGPNMLSGVEQHVLVPAGLANSAAHLLGQPLPNICTKQFFDAFTRMGGSGCTLCLILAVLLASRNSGSRKLCLLALAPALCNVNEPLIFGMPLVLNPLYAVPFVLVPAVQTATAYAATVLDLVPRTVAADMTWTTPVLVSGYFSTGSVAGALLQVANLALGAACYAPFVLLADRLGEQRSRRSLSQLMEAAQQPELRAGARKCLDLPGEAGRLAKILAHDLGRVLPTGEELYLVYQPQVDAATGRVTGVEALLRWRHGTYGEIPPPVTVSLAEDTGRIGDLGLMALTVACEQRVGWAGSVPEHLVMSVNVSPRQLHDPGFAARVCAVLAETGLPPHQLELEITESVSMQSGAGAVDMLSSLRRLGVRVAIDDFGMGHTSLRYLREFPVDTVKIDRSLTALHPQDVNWHIVRSIVELSRSLGIVTLVEGVENERQLATFRDLGCDVFQGYFFSRPLTGEACLEFVLRSAEGVQAHAGQTPPGRTDRRSERRPLVLLAEPEGHDPTAS